MRIGPWLTTLCALTLACGDDNGGGDGTGTTEGSGTSGGDGATGDGGTGGGTDGGDGGTDGGGTSGDGGSTGTGSGGDACAPITTFETGKSPTAEIHVDSTGQDSGSCGAAADPCASIQHAAGMAAPGTAVVVHEGMYPGGTYVADLAGTEAEPIWIGGAPGETPPVLDGDSEGIHLSRVRYLVLHDLEVRNATGNGINADDGGDYADPDATRHVVFRDLHVHDIGTGGNQDCLKLSGLDDYFVLDSVFERCGGGDSGSAIDHVGCHDGLLVGNRIVGGSGGGSGVQCKGGSANIEIRGNWFEDAGERGVNMGGSTGFEFFRPPLSTSEDNAEAISIDVVANVFVGGTTPFAFVGCDACRAVNNTIVDPQNWLFRILQETTSQMGYTFVPARNGLFANNIVYFERSQISTYVNIGADTDAPSFSFETNLWYAHDDPGQSDPAGDLPSAETGAVIGMDPMLQTPGYDIPAGSPAAGAGSAVDGLSSDYAGRCYASPPSIGAYEVP